jgi:hypothetical protein
MSILNYSYLILWIIKIIKINFNIQIKGNMLTVTELIESNLNINHPTTINYLLLPKEKF